MPGYASTNTKPRTTQSGIVCYFCGRWPAALYRVLEEKHGPRVCEFCVEEGSVVKINGVYVINPELPAATVESPDSGTHTSSSQRSGAPDSAA